MNEKRLVRYQDDKMFMGVATGLGEYLNIDPVLVRLAFVLLTLANGFGAVIYIIMAILMPVEGIPSAKAHAFDDEEIVIHDA